MHFFRPDPPRQQLQRLFCALSTNKCVPLPGGGRIIVRVYATKRPKNPYFSTLFEKMDFSMFPISFYLGIYSLHRLILYTTINRKSKQNFVEFLKNHTKSRCTKKATAQKAVQKADGSPRARMEGIFAEKTLSTLF